MVVGKARRLKRVNSAPPLVKPAPDDDNTLWRQSTCGHCSSTNVTNAHSARGPMAVCRDCGRAS